MSPSTESQPVPEPFQVGPTMLPTPANLPVSPAGLGSSSTIEFQPDIRSTQVDRPTSAFCQVNSVEKTRVWGLEFSRVNMEETLDQIDELIEKREPTQVITANLNFLMLCDQHQELIEIAGRAGLVLCDGMPILVRSKFSKHPLPERVAGSDLIYRMCERAASRGHRVFFLGAAEGVAQQTSEKLAELYPGLQIAGVECPPFSAWSEDYLTELKNRIRTSKPDLLLIAFGQPKGELWIEQHQRELQVPVCIQLGASFDFVAGTAKRAPKIYQRLGMEWLYRMSQDPKRLIPRYLRNALCLARLLIRDMMGKS